MRRYEQSPDIADAAAPRPSRTLGQVAHAAWRRSGEYPELLMQWGELDAAARVRWEQVAKSVERSVRARESPPGRANLGEASLPDDRSRRALRKGQRSTRSAMHFVECTNAPRAVCGVVVSNTQPLVFGDRALWSQWQGLGRCKRCERALQPAIGDETTG